MKDLSYYEKLGLKNAFSWSQEDFLGFLVSKDLQIEGSLRLGTMQGAKKLMREYNKYKFAINFYDGFFQKLCFKNNRKGRKILFYGIRFPELILGIKKHYPLGLMVCGKKDRLFSF